MAYTLGIDIGTYESKGVLVDKNGSIIAQARSAHKMLVPKPGWAEHRPEEDWWQDFIKICHAILEQADITPSEIDCISHSAIGPCMLPVDAKGDPLMNAVLYGVDTRATDQIAALNMRHGSDAIFARSGNALTSQSVGPKILWLRDTHPDLFTQAAYFLTATSFIAHRLAGAYVIDHHSAAGFTPLYDAENQCWNEEFAQDIVSVDKLPRLVWPTEIIGSVTAETARHTGLAEGTPVTSGTIDAAAEALSVGVITPGEMMIMYGSTMFLIQVTSERTRDPNLLYAPWIIPGTHAAMGGTATSGTLTHWFRDQLARDLINETAFEDLAAEAQTAPVGANGLLFLPYFSGERTPIYDPYAKGAFFGLTLAHTRADMIRAVLEGIAGSACHILATIADASGAATHAKAVGGGTKNAVWLQSVSDISGVSQQLTRHSFGAAFGDAFLAALAVGATEKEDIKLWNPITREVHPEPSEILQRQYNLSRDLYDATKEIAHRLSGNL